jgi:hemerythrin-like metal-binding protein
MKWSNWGAMQMTGNSAMDHGHKELVELINQLADGMQNDKPKAYCSNVLEQFVEHTKVHFRAEEKLMDAYRYPKTEEHKAIHAALLKDVLSFKASYDSGEQSEFTTLLVILDGWLTRDIQKADKLLADFVAAAGNAP